MGQLTSVKNSGKPFLTTSVSMLFNSEIIAMMLFSIWSQQQMVLKSFMIMPLMKLDMKGLKKLSKKMIEFNRPTRVIQDSLLSITTQISTQK